MGKKLADLIAEADSGARKHRAERSYLVCLRSDLVAEIQAISEEMDAIRAQWNVEGARKRKAVESDAPGVKELEDRLIALRDEMRDYEGTITVAATKTDGEWIQWCNAHPARDEDEPGHDVDMRLTGGRCNVEALLDDLGAYAVRWQATGEDPDDLTPAAFDKLGVSGPDKRELLRLVFGMYEDDTNLGKWLRGLSATLDAATSSRSAESSESPNESSSEPSSESDTSTTTATAT